MKILILSPKIPFPPKDGGAIATLNVAAGLSESGNSVTVLAINTKKHYFPEDKIPDTYKNRIQFKYAKHDTSPNVLNILFNFFFSRRPYMAKRFYSPRFKKLLRNVLHVEKYDIIQLEGPYTGIYLPLIRKYSDARVAFRAHNVESEIWEGLLKNEKSLLRKIYIKKLTHRLRKYELEVFRSSDMFIPITGNVCQFFLPFQINKPHYICPPGFCFSNYEPADTYHPGSFFFIGALDWKPNQDGILWFLEEIWSKREFNAIFHVAGRNAPEWLKTILIKTKHLVYHGEVENSISFIKQFETMICPVLSGSGIRIKILEAMLMGKPVVSTTKGAEGVNVTDGINILLADTAEYFEKQMLLVLNDKDLALKIGQQGRKLVIENFNNLAICRKLSDFYLNYLK